MKKYETVIESRTQFQKETGETIELYRIRALTSFADVQAGELGGYIEKEDNLSQEGTAWVHGDAKVYGDARVSGNANVHGEAEVYGNARMYGSAEAYGNARLYDNAKAHGEAEIYGNAKVYGQAEIYENAGVYGSARVHENARARGDANVHGKTELRGETTVPGRARCFIRNMIKPFASLEPCVLAFSAIMAVAICGTASYLVRSCLEEKRHFEEAMRHIRDGYAVYIDGREVETDNIDLEQYYGMLSYDTEKRKVYIAH